MAESKETKLHITLHVYDTDLAVYCDPDKEQYYRLAAKRITNTVNQYAQAYKGRKSEKNILYMALIDIALRYEEENGRNDTEPFKVVLSKLTSEIDEAMKK